MKSEKKEEHGESDEEKDKEEKDEEEMSAEERQKQFELAKNRLTRSS